MHTLQDNVIDESGVSSFVCEFTCLCCAQIAEWIEVFFVGTDFLHSGGGENFASRTTQGQVIGL